MKSGEQKMDIEEYARYIHLYVEEDIPSLLLETLDQLEWHTYLELGCGDGGLLYVLDRRGYLEGKEVYAIDLSETRVLRASQINPEFHCYVDDACNVQHIEPGSIDLLVSEQVIEHVPDDRMMVREIYRLLRLGGIAHISTVFKKWYGWYWYRCNGRWVLDPTHVREYISDDQLLNLFREAGLEILKTRKTLLRFSALNFFLKRVLFRFLPPNWRVYENRFLNALRRITRVPVPGYYYWEVVVRKGQGNTHLS